MLGVHWRVWQRGHRAEPAAADVHVDTGAGDSRSKRDGAAVAADGGRGTPERPGVMMFV